MQIVRWLCCRITMSVRIWKYPFKKNERVASFSAVHVSIKADNKEQVEAQFAALHCNWMILAYTFCSEGAR